jgi:hypothetical protein
LAAIGMVVLAMAIVTGSTVIALIVIGLAMVGLVLLARDWLKHREPGGTPVGVDRWPDERRPEEEPPQGDKVVNPDMFEPDLSYEEAIESAAEDEDLDIADESDSET